jgi:hypothetical protein
MDNQKGVPRHTCREWAVQGSEPELLTDRVFDQLVAEKGFQDGPYVETFGDGQGEPYNPDRQAWGTLKDGRRVFCELAR